MNNRSSYTLSQQLSLYVCIQNLCGPRINCDPCYRSNMSKYVFSFHALFCMLFLFTPPAICLTQAQHHMRGAELLSGTVPLDPNESAAFTFCCNIGHHDCYFNSHTVTFDRNNAFLFFSSYSAPPCSCRTCRSHKRLYLCAGRPSRRSRSVSQVVGQSVSQPLCQ